MERQEFCDETLFFLRARRRYGRRADGRGALSAAAGGLSPATGERTNTLPFVLGGVGLVAVAALVVLTVMDAKKKKNTPPPTDTPPAPPAGPNDEQDGL